MKTSEMSTEVEQRQVLNGNVQDLLLAAVP